MGFNTLYNYLAFEIQGIKETIIKKLIRSQLKTKHNERNKRTRFNR